MNLKIYRGLNIIYHKVYELILAIHAIYLKDHPDMAEQLDWIEVPHIQYMDDLTNYVMENHHKYATYEEFFEPELIDYMNNILVNRKFKNR